MIEVLPLDRTPQLRVVPSAPLAAPQERLVAARWSEYRRAHPQARDGLILSLASDPGPHMEAQLVRYRRWIAERQEATPPAPRPSVRPLAVCGLLRLDHSVLLGRRSTSVTQDRGLWELAPSGALDEQSLGRGDLVSPEAQLAIECREELELPWRTVRSARAFAIAVDHATAVVDIAFDVELAIGRKELYARFEARTSDEYEQLRLVSRRELPTFIEREPCSPTTRALLAFLWWAARGRVDVEA